MMKPLLIAHRGDTRASRENSVAAILAAERAGADWVEVDIRATADGHLVLAHDERVGTLEIAESPLDALRRAHSSLATLDEALEAAGNMRGINLELKPPIPDPIEFLGLLLESVAGFSGDLLFSSFYLPVLTAGTGILPGDTGVLTGAAYDTDGKLALEAADSVGADVLLPEHPAVTPELIETVHDSGRRLMTWTVNDPERYRLLAGWGADGIITDTLLG